MSMEFVERSLITAVGRFRENDMWVRLLTPGRGALTGFAFGGCRSRRRFCGCLDPLNTVLFQFKESGRGGYLCLTEGTLVHSPCRLRKDPARLGMAVNCLKFAEAVSGGRESARAVYDLTTEALLALESDEPVQPLFPMLFRARLSFEAGFGPDFTCCALCGAELAQALFMLEDGLALCPACGGASQGRILCLHQESLQALETVCSLPPAQWGDMELSHQAREECSRVVDDFVRFHVGLAWERGAFRRV